MEKFDKRAGWRFSQKEFYILMKSAFEIRANDGFCSMGKFWGMCSHRFSGEMFLVCRLQLLVL